MSPEQARGQTRRQARRHLGVRLCVLRTADRTCRVCRRHHRGHDCRGDRTGAGLEGAAASNAARVRRLLQRCLEKDPSRRLRDIGDARGELEDVQAPPRGTDTDVPPPPPVNRTAGGRKVALLRRCSAPPRWYRSALFYCRSSEPPAAPIAVQDLTLTAPPGTRLNDLPGLALSPDGSTVAFIANGDVWVRPVGGGAATACSGSRRLSGTALLVAGRSHHRLLR